MTDQITTALKSAIESIRTDYRESLERYNRLDRKSRTGDGLDFEESEQHDLEDGYSFGIHLALLRLTRELSSNGVQC